MNDDRDYLWDRSGDVDPDVEALERALAPLTYRGATVPRRVPVRARRSPGSIAGAVLLLAAALGGLGAVVLAQPASPLREARKVAWHPPELALAASAPRPPALEIVREKDGRHDPATLEVGGWLETDAASRARVILGALGTVDVEPGSRLRLVASAPDVQRLDLARGAIEARVNAPPRLFVVGTPSAAAVDLGCAYRLEVKDDGSAWLRVTSGYVSLEWEGKTSLVPAGAVCRTRDAKGPGTPRFADAPPALTAAIDRFDEAGDAAAALEALPHARRRDALTVWHLLFRVPPELRARVLDRLRALVPAPGGLDRARAEALDPEALRPYEERLRATW